MMLLITPEAADASRIALACGRDVPFHHVEGDGTDLNAVLDLVESEEVDVAVVGPDLDVEVAEKLVSELSSAFPLLGIVEYVDDDPVAIREALRAGTTDVVTDEMSAQEIADVIDRTRNRTARLRDVGTPAAAVDSGPEGHVITVLSPRGGVGRTLIAASLGLTLQQICPDEVVLVDLDLQSGDIAPLLGLAPTLTIGSVVGQADDLRSADLKALLIKDSSGLHVLAAPDSLTASVAITPDLISAVVQTLAMSFRYVVIDTSAELSEVSLAALDQTTDLICVCAPDVPSVRAIGRATDALDELRMTAPERHLVLNKFSERYGMPLRDIEAVSGMSPIAQIPAAKDIAMALNTGMALDTVVHPKSVTTRALRGLIETLVPEARKQNRRRRLLSRSR